MTLSSILSSPYRMFSKRDEVANDAEGRGGGAELVTRDGRALPLQSAVLRAECAGGIARVVLEQTFENPYQETLHVTYKMPLPADGAVSGYEFTVGPRTIKGRVESKESAREQFEQAIATGKTAGLLEQQRADIFTQEIGNIPAGETIIARITVDQKLRWLPEGEWELRFPTVIGPRYIGAEVLESEARDVHVQVAGKDETRGRIHLEVDVKDEITKGRKVESPSHRIAETTPHKYMLAALEGAKLDRDVVVRWAVAEQSVGLSLAMARPHGKEPHAHVSYGLLTIVPPSLSAKYGVAPRDLIVLLDTSGSMGGPPLAQAKKVISLMINSLSPQDRLEIIEFSSTANAWQRDPLPATPDTKKKATAWLTKLEAGGATEMYSAIVQALRALRPGAQRQVVLVTDGYIGGEQQVVDLLHERLPADCRMHVVGVGSAVNRSLATAIARAGRGAEVLVGLDEDAERPARRLLDRTALPILTDVTVEGSGVVEVAPQHVPDVFAGAPLVCGVKLAAEGGEMIVSGKLANNTTWEKKMRVPAMTAGEGNQAIVALFAREHVADLEMRWTIGKETALIDRTIEKVGVVFQIATRRTSWVAIDDVVTVDPKSGARQVAQPQELPYGTSMQSFFTPPQGGGGQSVTRAGTISPMGMQLFKALTQQHSSSTGDEEEDAAFTSVNAPAPPMSMGRFSPPPTGAPPAAPGFGAPPPQQQAFGSAPARGAAAPPPSIQAAPMKVPPPVASVSMQAHLGAKMARRRGRPIWISILVFLFVFALIAFAIWFFFFFFRH